MLNARHDDDLDPRRVPRGAARRRDWASMSRTVSIARAQELLMHALVRLGLVR